MEAHQIEKWVWSEEDFDCMDWHDCRIHAIAFPKESFKLLFDIDYILEWIQPEPPEPHFKFWTAPATLVFENIYEVDFDIESYIGGLEIDRIRREEPQRPRNTEYIQKPTEWTWTIECQEGEIRLKSVGFCQYIRSAPLFGGQRLELAERGGYCFTTGRTDAADA